jgi:UDPglucose--hexose-1-phosphate uridylyltransferase
MEEEGSLRRDALTGVWTIFAPVRETRPIDFTPETAAPPLHDDPSGCPFCPGNEEETPPAVFEELAPDDASVGLAWTVRVVGNRYPALVAPDEETGSDPMPAPRPYEATTGFGGHEVVIETPRHGEGLADFAPAHARLIVDAYAERLRRWREDGRVAAVVIFRNQGALSGASLAHAHTQLVALPRVPDTLVREVGNFSTYAQGNTGHCLLCDMTDADAGLGLVVSDDGVTRIVSPWAATAPYQLRIVPHRCSPTFADVSEAERESVAAAMVTVARAYRGALGEATAFNLVVHTAPFAVERTGALPYHWHIEVVPRFSCAAGFEVGTGMGINSTGPARAAERLRSAIM